MEIQPSVLICTALLVLLLFDSCDKRIRKNGSGNVTSTTRALSNFSQLDVEGSYELFIHQDDDPKVVITTDDNIVSEVRSFVQDNKLFVEMNDDYYNYNYTQMEVHVYTNAMNYVEINGDVNTTIEDTIQSGQFVLKQNGRGHVMIRFAGDSVSIENNGQSQFDLIGQANHGVFVMNGSGKLDGLSMQLNEAEAKIHGSSDIYLNCTENLDATIDGSGNIRYTGTPLVTSHINGSGSVAPY